MKYVNIQLHSYKQSFFPFSPSPFSSFLHSVSRLSLYFEFDIRIQLKSGEIYFTRFIHIYDLEFLCVWICIFSDRRMGGNPCNHSSKAGRQCFKRCATSWHPSEWQMDCVFDSNYHTYGCNKLFFSLSPTHFSSLSVAVLASHNIANAFIYTVWFLTGNIVGGDIRIFRKEDTHSFKLMAEANDPDPLPVEYISFGSYNTNLVKFYFNCSFSFATPDAVYDTTDHPLLARDVPASIDLRNCMWLHFQLSKKNHNQLVEPCSFVLSLSFSLFRVYFCLSSWKFHISPRHKVCLLCNFRQWLQEFRQNKRYQKFPTRRFHSAHYSVHSRSTRWTHSTCNIKPSKFRTRFRLWIW